jgi:transcriptional regulator with XRE-family HTH domain
VSIGANIERLMKGRKWTDAHLTVALIDHGIAVHQVTVKRWRDGGSKPGVTALCALADIFETTVDDIVRGDEPVPAGV